MNSPTLITRKPDESAVLRLLARGVVATHAFVHRPTALARAAASSALIASVAAATMLPQTARAEGDGMALSSPGVSTEVPGAARGGQALGEIGRSVGSAAAGMLGGIGRLFQSAASAVAPQAQAGVQADSSSGVVSDVAPPTAAPLVPKAPGAMAPEQGQVYRSLVHTSSAGNGGGGGATLSPVGATVMGTAAGAVLAGSGHRGTGALAGGALGWLVSGALRGSAPAPASATAQGQLSTADSCRADSPEAVHVYQRLDDLAITASAYRFLVEAEQGELTRVVRDAALAPRDATHAARVTARADGVNRAVAGLNVALLDLQRGIQAGGSIAPVRNYAQLLADLSLPRARPSRTVQAAGEPLGAAALERAVQIQSGQTAHLGAAARTPYGYSGAHVMDVQQAPLAQAPCDLPAYARAAMR